MPVKISEKLTVYCIKFLIRLKEAGQIRIQHRRMLKLQRAMPQQARLIGFEWKAKNTYKLMLFIRLMRRRKKWFIFRCLPHHWKACPDLTFPLGRAGYIRSTIPSGGSRGSWAVQNYPYYASRFIVHMSFRKYQFDIVQSCLFNNTLVCLPTGLGTYRSFKVT